MAAMLNFDMELSNTIFLRCYEVEGHLLLGWRPLLLGWRPLLSGWRPFLLG